MTTPSNAHNLPDSYKQMMSHILCFVDILYTKNMIDADQLNACVNDLPIFDSVTDQVSYFDTYYSPEILHKMDGIRVAMYDSYHAEHAEPEPEITEMVVVEQPKLEEKKEEDSSVNSLKKILKRIKKKPENPSETKKEETKEKVESEEPKKEEKAPAPKKVIRRIIKKVDKPVDETINPIITEKEKTLKEETKEKEEISPKKVVKRIINKKIPKEEPDEPVEPVEGSSPESVTKKGIQRILKSLQHK